MRLLAFLIAIMCACILACSSDEPSGPPEIASSQTQTATATSTPVAEPTATALANSQGERRTGDPDLDAIIDAVEAKDASALRALLIFQTQACTTELGLGGPPKCLDGQADGTEVGVFAYSLCEPGWIRDDGIEAALTETLSNMPELYAAFRAPAGYTLAQTAVQSVLLFDGDDPRVDESGFNRGLLIGIRDGGIIAIAPGCGAGSGADGMIPDGVDAFLVDPPP